MEAYHLAHDADPSLDLAERRYWPSVTEALDPTLQREGYVMVGALAEPTVITALAPSPLIGMRRWVAWDPAVIEEPQWGGVWGAWVWEGYGRGRFLKKHPDCRREKTIMIIH